MGKGEEGRSREREKISFKITGPRGGPYGRALEKEERKRPLAGTVFWRGGYDVGSKQEAIKMRATGFGKNKPGD